MARAFELAVVVWGPLAQGRLTGKYLRGEDGRLSLEGSSWPGADNDDAVREVVAIAKEGGPVPRPGGAGLASHPPGHRDPADRGDQAATARRQPRNRRRHAQR